MSGAWELDAFALSMAFLFGVVCMLIMLAYLLEHYHIKIFHETGAAVILGVMLGKVVELVAPSEDEAAFVSFSSSLFFTLLLPPIILNSGYNMKRRRFFTNLAAILTYSLVGTIISFAATGVGMVLLGRIGLHNWSTVECFIFSSLASATDPVSTLAIMETTPVSGDLFAIVLGESVFNDAVAIVLHTTALTFVDSSLSAGSILGAIAFFLAVFVGSVVLGIGFGLLTSYILKVSRLRDHPHLEQGLLVSMAYAAYFLAQGLDLSGIVAILFCGVTLAHYAYNSLRPSSKKITKSTLKLMAYIAETVVFLFLGLALFAFRQEYNIWLIICAALVLLATRALHIFPLGFLLNRARRATLSKPMLGFLWFAGLRGAIAFALALDVPTEHGRSVRTVTLIIALVSILAMGGATHPVLSFLGLIIEDGENNGAGDDDHIDNIALEDLGGPTPPPGRSAAAGLVVVASPARVSSAMAQTPPRHTINMNLSRSETWWIAFDRKYLKPLFVRGYRPGDHGPDAHARNAHGAPYSRSISSHSSSDHQDQAPPPLRRPIHGHDDDDDDIDPLDPETDAYLGMGAAYVPYNRWNRSSSGSGSATLADLPSDSGGGSSDL